MFLLHAIDQTVKKVKAQTANILTLINLSLRWICDNCHDA